MKDRSTARVARMSVAVMVVVVTAGQTVRSHAAEYMRPTNRVVAYLGEIVVNASRTDRDLLATPTVESPSLGVAISTVDAETIRLQDAGTLAEAIDFSTGVFTEERGRKEKQLSSFRGQIYPYPDFTFNGVWQRSFWEVPSFFPAAAIERVEILRSGGAIMVGPNSGLVGAINIVPRRFDRLTTILDAQAGSFGSYRSSLVHGNRSDNGDYTVGANVYGTDGPEGENAGEQFYSLFGTAGWDAGDRVQVEFTVYALTGERQLRRIQDPGLKSLQNRTEEYSPYTSYGGILRMLVQHDADASTEFDGGYVFRSGNYRRRDPNKPETENRERDWEYNAGIIHARKLWDANTLRLGAQYNRWICPDGKRDFVGKRMDVETLSAVLVDEQQWDRLTLDGGLRLTRIYYRDYTDTTFDIAGNSLSGQSVHEEWGDVALTGTLGAEYRIVKPVALYAHAALGSVDAPPGAVSETASGLDRESRLILDGGFSMALDTVGTFKAGLFAMFRRDAILLTETSVTDDGETFNLYANDDVRQYGLELEFRSARILEFFTLFGNATVMTSERSDAGDWTSYREIPKVIAVAGVNSAFGRVDVNLFGKYVSRFENKRFAEDKQYHDLGDFVDLNLTAGVKLGRKKATRLYASLENLLDDEYSTVVGYPDYGFQAYAGIQHRF